MGEFAEAARWAASFPTDEQVEAAAKSIMDSHGWSGTYAYESAVIVARAALEAVALDPKERNDASDLA
jgi:hypothetical protein